MSSDSDNSEIPTKNLFKNTKKSTHIKQYLPTQSTKPITVKKLNDLLKDTLTKYFDEQYDIEGEISNLKYSNGNTYFTLKDNESAISVNAWKKKLEFNNGDSVVVSGKINLFVKNGTYQLTLYSIKKVGLGDLHLNYIKLKETFEKKGYFTKKRALPQNITTVGIITSTEGAALQDILYVLKKNNFFGKVIIKNCIAQGPNCGQSVKEGIKFFNKLHKKSHIDLLIIGRGGGSFEDLMGFSTKEVVKTIYKSPIITISAVGHEVDFMLSDFSADIRAPTPSIAGENISQNHKFKKEKIDMIKNDIDKLKLILTNKLNSLKNDYIILKQNFELTTPTNLIDNKIFTLKRYLLEMKEHINHQISKHKTDIEKLDKEQNNYDHLQFMKKGYSIVTTDTSDIITSKQLFTEMMANERKLKIIFADGEVQLDLLKFNQI